MRSRFRSINVRALSILFTGLAAGPVAAQNHGNVWQFGDDVGLFFHGCVPHVIEGSNAGFEGCASVCGSAGELLFYTNSEWVWNSAHVPMPNGFLNVSANTLSQVLIVKQPGPGTLYYIVTTTIQGDGPGALSYHVVDMAEDDGLGDVVSQDNTLFAGTSTEHVAATWHANGTDIWIMAHAYPENDFLCYLVTPSGVSTTPVISSVGPTFPACNSNINTRGEIKFSIDGTRLAMAGNGVGNEPGSDVLALFHFDAATGVVSDPLELPAVRGDFGLSFSPDGTKLYGATWKALNFTATDVNVIYQFDLSSGDSATIAASMQIIHTAGISEPFGCLKLGPDGRIYVSGNGRQYLGVINEPDLAAPACNYVDDGLYLNGATVRFGLNNYIEYVNCGSVTTGAPDHGVEGLMLTMDLAGDRITLSGPGMFQAPVSVFDPAGRCVLRGTLTNGSLDISSLSRGSYALALESQVLRFTKH